MTAPTLLAGASGYAFKEWKGNFYPEKIKPEECWPLRPEAKPSDCRLTGTY